MKTRNFSFELPEELIAQNPVRERGTSRLMLVRRQTGTAEHFSITDLPDLLPSGTVLVINDSRVRKARIYGRTEYGGEVEFLLLQPIDKHCWKCMVSKAKRQKPGRTYTLPGNVRAEIESVEDEFRIVRFDPDIDDEYLEEYGHLPLPPYIRREDTPEDYERYQTVYAAEPGSVAAPTAGLHLTRKLISRLEERGIEVVHITLHVGIGTFLPIRTEEVETHQMHTEQYFISSESAGRINRAKREGRKICAVGTTSVRTLESACRQSEIVSGEGSTSLYIYPGYTFRAVDMMLTNFHTPESTLLVMVSAFAGKDLIEKSYREAIKERYRFFSYGDAMLIQ
ncbi:MAG: tRNA preQ1(34) S-adenosylmethionine ribosyltransferase-isomerase QueA [Sediminispirochaetaceae bacterium]